jgi:hypothetical protein
MFHSFFYLSNSTPKKWISKVLEKPNFIYFLFFTNFETLFFVFYFFHIHFLEPILHHLTKSQDFKFVFQSSGIQNKKPLFTVYLLYIKPII